MTGLRQIMLVGIASVIAGVTIAFSPDLPAIMGPATMPGNVTGSAHVIDGDTISMNGVKIRLNGIDAPESTQNCFGRDTAEYRCGHEAGNFLESLVGAQPVRCDGDAADRYGRLIATCYLGNQDINAEMVRAGWAVAYRHYTEKYASLEQEAKDAGLGLWQGSFRMPWVWRKQSRIAAAAPDKDCPIKGNISGNGRIYHVPGSRWYSKTQINEQTGERWFCSEVEALAAGWRSPRYN